MSNGSDFPDLGGLIKTLYVLAAVGAVGTAVAIVMGIWWISRG